MQYFLFDLSLTLAALLGYRAFEAVVRRGAPVASLARHAAANTRTHASQPKIRVHRRPLPVSPALPQPAPVPERPRAKLHRLINFW